MKIGICALYEKAEMLMKILLYKNKEKVLTKTDDKIITDKNEYYIINPNLYKCEIEGLDRVYVGGECSIKYVSDNFGSNGIKVEWIDFGTKKRCYIVGI